MVLGLQMDFADSVIMKTEEEFLKKMVDPLSDPTGRDITLSDQMKVDYLEWKLKVLKKAKRPDNLPCT